MKRYWSKIENRERRAEEIESEWLLGTVDRHGRKQRILTNEQMAYFREMDERDKEEREENARMHDRLNADPNSWANIMEQEEEDERRNKIRSRHTGTLEAKKVGAAKPPSREAGDDTSFQSLAAFSRVRAEEQASSRVTLPSDEILAMNLLTAPKQGPDQAQDPFVMDLSQPEGDKQGKGLSTSQAVLKPSKSCTPSQTSDGTPTPSTKPPARKPGSKARRKAKRLASAESGGQQPSDPKTSTQPKSLPQ
jgi:hypothetical protein